MNAFLCVHTDYMKDRILNVLQRVGRSFMLPIAILPVAGLLLGIGESLSNSNMIAAYGLQWLLGEGTFLHAVLKVMSNAGNSIFTNLPLIFAMGVALGMAKKEKEVAVLAAAISFFIMHTSIGTMLDISGMAQRLPQGSVTSVVGITSLQMGMFGGVIVGLGTAALHNRFYKIRLPRILSFFGGTRFVPIICSIVYLLVGILMFYIWPMVQGGDLCAGRACPQLRLLWYISLWGYRTLVDSVRSSSRVLSAILADGGGRNYGGCRCQRAGSAEYIFCPACRSKHSKLQCGGDTLHGRKISPDDFRTAGCCACYVSLCPS